MEDRLTEIKKQKQQLQEIKEKLINDNRQIMQTIRDKNRIHFNAKEYHKYKNNIPLLIGTITFAGLTFFASRMYDFSTLETLLISFLPSATLTTGMQTYFSYKKGKCKKECPEMNLEQYDIEYNGKQIEELFEQSFTITDKINDINIEIEEKEKIQKCNPQMNETNEQPKVKVMTLTRKK